MKCIFILSFFCLKSEAGVIRKHIFVINKVLNKSIYFKWLNLNVLLKIIKIYFLSQEIKYFLNVHKRTDRITDFEKIGFLSIINCIITFLIFTIEKINKTKYKKLNFINYIYFSIFIYLQINMINELNLNIHENQKLFIISILYY